MKRFTISAVQLENVKAITDRYELKPITLITGRNASGKTAIVAAIRLGLAGSLPVLGKRPGAIYKLAGNPEGPGKMAITLATSPDGAIQHTWTRDKKGTVSYTSTLTDDLRWPDAMLDFRSFLSLPGTDQAKALFSRCRVEKTVEDCMKVLADETPIPNAKCAPLLQQTVKSLAQQSGQKPTVQEWLNASEVTLTSALKVAKAVAASDGAALIGYQKAQPKKVAHPDELEEVKQQITRAQAQVQAQQNALDEYNRDALEYARKRAKLKALIDPLLSEREIEHQVFLEREQCEAPTECPTCGCKGAEFTAYVKRRRERVIEQNRKEKDERDAEINRINGLIDAIGKEPQPPAAIPAQTQARINDLQEELTKLSIQDRDADRWDEWVKERDALEAKANASNNDREVKDALLARLRALRDSLIDDGINRLLVTANKFVRAGTPKALLDAPLSWNKDLAEFGRRNGTGWVSLDTFSGYEEQVAFAALSVTVAAEQSAFRVVIMDEMGRMDTKSKGLVMERMDELISAKVIDQFIGVDTNPYSAGLKSVHVISL